MYRDLSPVGGEQVVINLGDRSYCIDIAAGLLDRAEAFSGLPSASTAMIVTNDTVAPIYLERLRGSLAPHYRTVLHVVLPDGEAFKTWETLNRIFDALLGAACDRKTVLFALGGGVVGDMTGFAAAAFMRGMPFVQVPTTLLADQVRAHRRHGVSGMDRTQHGGAARAGSAGHGACRQAQLPDQGGGGGPG